MEKANALSKIMLQKPAVGETVQIAVQPGCTYTLEFATETTTWDKRGKDIVIVFDDGGVMELDGFMPAVEHEDVYLEVQGGGLVSGRDLADILTQEPLQTDACGAAPEDSPDGLFFPRGYESEPWTRLNEAGISLPDTQPDTQPDGREFDAGAPLLSCEGGGLLSSQGAGLLFLDSKNLPPVDEALDCFTPPDAGCDWLFGACDSALPPAQHSGCTMPRTESGSPVFSASFGDLGEQDMEPAMSVHLFLLALC